MIELDELLHGDPNWTQVIDFFEHGEFCEEHYLVDAIKKHLLTLEQKITLFNFDISIEDMLNGRVTGEDKQQAVQVIFSDWNERLGSRNFVY